jgi:hypothetical protein
MRQQATADWDNFSSVSVRCGAAVVYTQYGTRARYWRIAKKARIQPMMVSAITTTQ